MMIVKNVYITKKLFFKFNGWFSNLVVHKRHFIIKDIIAKFAFVYPHSRNVCSMHTRLLQYWYSKLAADSLGDLDIFCDLYAGQDICLLQKCHNFCVSCFSHSSEGCSRNYPRGWRQRFFCPEGGCVITSSLSWGTRIFKRVNIIWSWYSDLSWGWAFVPFRMSWIWRSQKNCHPPLPNDNFWNSPELWWLEDEERYQLCSVQYSIVYHVVHNDTHTYLGYEFLKITVNLGEVSLCFACLS